MRRYVKIDGVMTCTHGSFPDEDILVTTNHADPTTMWHAPGWLCPRCKVINGPSVTQCTCRVDSPRYATLFDEGCSRHSSMQIRVRAFIDWFCKTQERATISDIQAGLREPDDRLDEIREAIAECAGRRVILPMGKIGWVPER